VVNAILVMLVVVLSVTYFLYRSVQIVPQASAQIVERFGRYRRTLEPGLRFLVPIADTIRATVDMREQVVPFPPQEVITKDNLLVYIDWVVYYQVTDPHRATYEIQNYVQAIEYLVSTMLRDVISRMSLKRTLNSRDEINALLRDALDPPTRIWGIAVNRVELRTIQPPPGYLEQGTAVDPEAPTTGATTAVPQTSNSTGPTQQVTKSRESRPEEVIAASLFVACLGGLTGTWYGRLLDGVLMLLLAAFVLWARMIARPRTPPPETKPPVWMGSAAIVTRRVDSAGAGQIWVAGQVYPARPLAQDGVYEPGVEVHIAAIDNGTALVT